MGGAIGNVLTMGGSVVSTAASLLGNDTKEKKYYRSLAKTAEEQARQVEENARRNALYMMQEAGYESKQLSDSYRDLVGTQKTSLAASGLTGQSATAQLILKNSRLNAALDQERLAANLNRSIYENDTYAGLEAQQYRAQAKQYRQATKNKWSWWSKVGTAVSGFFSRNKE
ncbi:MAG: hypothetical protein IKN49_03560 [Elusimicrobiaceae bacterium]|nr:hypothetical protein [Elusimicrobiaceae bacterium]